jgi:putative ABC transport system permease protein
LIDADDERAPGAVVVNETLARRAWPSGSPIGQRIQMGGADTTWRTVVGVVADIHHRGLDAEARPEIYLPHAQWTNGGGAIREMAIVVRANTDPRGLASGLRRSIQSIDPDLPVTGIRTMQEVMSDSSATRRVSFIILIIIAAAASSIAAVGLYGVISFTVAQRTRDIGIRRALGASTGTVVGLVARQSLSPIASGVIGGLVGGVVLARLMAALLFQVRPTDPATFALVIGLVTVIAIAATIIPARRAAHIDPLAALRGD